MSVTDQHADRVVPSASASIRHRNFGVATAIAITVAAAVAVNTAIWAIGEIAGGSFEYTNAGSVESAAPAGVVFLTAVPLAAGLTLVALLARRWSGIVRVAQVVGSVLALATIAGTIGADFDAASTVALSLAHVALVPFVLIGLEAVRRP